jgi:UDP-glucose 4-epimerase
MPVSLFLDTPYQITKALGEFYCNYYLPQLATVRCRFFNSFGPGEVPGRYRNVIPNFIWSAMRNEPLVITGTGEETRDFIFVEDLVGGLIRCALADVRGEAFNLGTGVETRVIDVASAILQETGSKSEIVYTPRRSWDHSIRRQANISKAREQLSFDAPTAFSDGLSRTVEWFVSERGRIEQLLETK